MQKNKVAFTLAEVLVTLGIIGVVSAMTIPTLIQNYQKQVFVTQLKKAYSELSQGFQNVLVDKKAMTLAETKMFNNNPSSTETFFRTYFKTSAICTSSKSDCLNLSDYTNLSGNTITLGSEVGQASVSSGTWVCAALRDGVTACISPYPINSELPMYVDTNGKQGPNVAGRDLFYFYVNSRGEINGVASPGGGEHGNGTETSSSAFNRILRDGWEMNY